MSSPSTRTRGFALAAARARGERAAAREAATLAEMPPPGLERVHRSWYTPPPRSRRADAGAHLARAAYGHLVAMDGGDLSRRAADAIERAIVALGRRRLGLAFVGAPRAGLAQLCARLGEPSASALVAEVRALHAAAPPSEAIKAAQRALFQSGDEIHESADLFFRVGAAWLGPALALDGDELMRVAQRLPRALGQQLLDAAATPLAERERADALAFVADAVL